MLTAETIKKIYTNTNHIPASRKVRAKPLAGNVSQLALDTVLKVISSYNGFITIKLIVDKTSYGRATVQRTVALLECKRKVITKRVKNGRSKTLYIKAVKE